MKLDVRNTSDGCVRISFGRDMIYIKTQGELDAFWAGVRVAHARISADLLQQAKEYPASASLTTLRALPAQPAGDVS